MMPEHPLDDRSGFTHQLRRKSRARRESARDLASAAEGFGTRRNDPLPALVLVDFPVEQLVVKGRPIRRRDESHIQAVARSIACLGFCQPVLIDKDKGVIDGLIRIEAAKRCGLSTIPCIRIDHLNEVELRIVRLALNRLQERGEWDRTLDRRRARGGGRRLARQSRHTRAPHVAFAADQAAALRRGYAPPPGPSSSLPFGPAAKGQSIPFCAKSLYNARNEFRPQGRQIND
jgi:hypothetical protein